MKVPAHKHFKAQTKEKTREKRAKSELKKCRNGGNKFTSLWTVQGFNPKNQCINVSTLAQNCRQLSTATVCHTHTRKHSSNFCSQEIIVAFKVYIFRQVIQLVLLQPSFCRTTKAISHRCHISPSLNRSKTLPTKRNSVNTL